MHTYLRKNIGWYNKWHEHWAHGPTHWVIFTSAVFVAILLITYVSNAGSGAGVVAS